MLYSVVTIFKILNVLVDSHLCSTCFGFLSSCCLKDIKVKQDSLDHLEARDIMGGKGMMGKWVLLEILDLRSVTACYSVIQ